jgi:hypothetical protein
MARYSDEDLIEFLRRFHKENGKPPSSPDFRKNKDYPAPITYLKRFGSWNKALKKQDLRPKNRFKLSSSFSGRP